MKRYTLSLFAILVLGLLISPLTTKAYSFQTNLGVGSRGADVVALQNILIQKGFLNGRADGVFGRLTLSAVQKLQIANGFSSTSGAFGPKTRDLLNNVVAYTNGTFPVGCTSNSGYSTVTGSPCTSTITYPAGCTSSAGYSSITGQVCSGTTTAVNYKTYTQPEKFSFKYNASQATRMISQNETSVGFTNDYGNPGFSVNYFEGALPADQVPCKNLTSSTTVINGKTFTFCDSKAEPWRTSIYVVGTKTLIVGDSSGGKFIDLGSVEILNNQTGEWGNDVDGKHIGYIKSISSQNGTSSLVTDYVQWISPCVANAQTSYCMNGYDVVNSNTLLRTFPISNNVQIKLQTYSNQTSGLDTGNFNWNQVVSLSTFTNVLNNPTGMYPAKSLLYWITLSNGVVTDITEQYQP